jgi:hypothetical protein
MKITSKLVGMSWTVCSLAACLAVTSGCSHSDAGSAPSANASPASTLKPEQIVATDPRIPDQQRIEIQQRIAAQAAARTAMQASGHAAPTKTQ